MGGSNDDGALFIIIEYYEQPNGAFVDKFGDSQGPPTYISKYGYDKPVSISGLPEREILYFPFTRLVLSEKLDCFDPSNTNNKYCKEFLKFHALCEQKNQNFNMRGYQNRYVHVFIDKGSLDNPCTSAEN